MHHMLQTHSASSSLLPQPRQEIGETPAAISRMHRHGSALDTGKPWILIKSCGL